MHFEPIQRPPDESPWERHNGLSRYERITIANIRLCRAYMAARDENIKLRLAEAGERTYAWLHDAVHEHTYADCPSQGATEIAAALEQALHAAGASDSTMPLVHLNEHLSGDESKSILDQLIGALGTLSEQSSGPGLGILSGSAAEDFADLLKRHGASSGDRVRVVLNTQTGEQRVIVGNEQWEAFKDEVGADNVEATFSRPIIEANPDLKDALDAIEGENMTLNQLSDAVDDALNAVASHGTWNVPGSMLKLRLLTPEAYDALPDDTEVFNIFGVRFIKGEHERSQDTRGGYLAYGLPIEEI